MVNMRRQGLIWVLVCAGISILWGTSLARKGEWIDFRTVYAGSRCLIHHHNPYNLRDVVREYESEDGQRPKLGPGITLQVNLPTTYVLMAPLAALSWGPAHILWMLLTGCVFALAILLMWHVGASYAPNVSTFLACVIAIDFASAFAAGNTAEMVVGLCGIAVWCFLQSRFGGIGVCCLALSLAIKPHDAGLIWLYFLLAGGAYRKRALQSLAITAVIGLTAALWFWHVAPTWVHDWNGNLAIASARGGINDPGPNTSSAHSIYTVVDLQAAISIFRDDPRFYNIASYLFCGALLLVWSIWALRTRFTVFRAWFALAAATALTLLITYHRPWDTKLVMLAIPPCSMLWARRGRLGKIAFPITAAAALFAGDVPLAVFKTMADSLHTSEAWLGGKLLTVVLRRPESIALVAMGVFYLWTYLAAAEVHAESIAERSSVRMILRDFRRNMRTAEGWRWALGCFIRS